ncbi:MAG: hydantoinase B/oxoprolinase family protein [Alphaproteobacteria bacterium]|nr:hydantoinase B/oxoprolinase family protein [Alphaproteobacteria bacterium]
MHLSATDNSTGQTTLVRKGGETTTLKASDGVTVEAGDMIKIETPGGGGYGPADGAH